MCLNLNLFKKQIETLHTLSPKYMPEYIHSVFQLLIMSPEFKFPLRAEEIVSVQEFGVSLGNTARLYLLIKTNKFRNI